LFRIVEGYMRNERREPICDFFVCHTGDNIAALFNYSLETEDEGVHKLTWNAFTAQAKIAKKQGFSGAGQDLLKNSFFGNMKGMGPATLGLTLSTDMANEFKFVMMNANYTERDLLIERTSLKRCTTYTTCCPIPSSNIEGSQRRWKGFSLNSK
jgi:fructose 1,6-bisphosphatase